MAQDASPEAGGRLNMLLSYGGWKSESWADCLPRLLEPMGVRTWRVQTGREATDLLRAGDPFHIAVVDLRLPMDRIQGADEDPSRLAEGGSKLLALLSRCRTRPATIVVKPFKSQRQDAMRLAEALRHGAFAVVDRPVDIELMLEVFRRVLRRYHQDRWPAG